MSQAVGIANAVIPVEAGPKVSSTETALKNPKQSADSADPLNQTDNTAGEITPKTSTSEESFSAAFSKVLQKKLEKKEKISQEEKTKTEITQELFIQSVSVPAEAILSKDKPSAKITRQTDVNQTSLPEKTALRKVNTVQKQTEIARLRPAPSATSAQETVGNNKIQRQIVPVAKEPAKEPAASNLTRTDATVENQNQSAKTAVKDVPAGRSDPLTESKRLTLANRNLPHETAIKQSAQDSSGSSQAPSTQIQALKASVQTQPTSQSQTVTIPSNQSELPAGSAAAVKQEGSVSSSLESENNAKENKTPDVSKTQLVHEQTVHKSISQNTMDAVPEGLRPVSSIHMESSPARVLTQTTTANPSVSSVSRSAFDPSAPLSASEQVLRGIQSVSDSEVRSIQLALSPAGLGIVRIHLQREGEEISGVLEVQKTETRREIEKSLPQIVSILDSQGLQVRRIEVNPLPNSNQKQQEFESSDQSALQHEMSEQDHSRYRTEDPSDNNVSSIPVHEIITNGDIRGYMYQEGSESLNLYA